jgi:hypothetical protein
MVTSMACMCGDICCSSCGPAQGNYRCSACGTWSIDGPCTDPAACAKIEEADILAEQEFYRQL